MKKLISSLLVGGLLYIMPHTADAATLSETEKQVNIAEKASTILHEKYTKNLDYVTQIGTPYHNARYEVGKAKSMVDSLPSSERKTQLLTRVAGYQKVVKNGNAYNNAVKTYPILKNFQKDYLDTYLNDSKWYGIRDYNYFNYKLSLLQQNYDKVYGKLIQDEFKTRYLVPIKKTRDDVYYLLNARKDLELAEKDTYKNPTEAKRQLGNALTCINKVRNSKQKNILLAHHSLLQNLIQDRESGDNEAFYISMGSYSLGFPMKIYTNLEGESMTLWIADAEQYPSYQSLKNVYGDEVYGYFNSHHAGHLISKFNWWYRDWSSAYHMNIVWGYWDLDWINYEDDEILPVGTKFRVTLEVVKENGEVVVKEQPFTMTEELFKKAHVKVQ
ncbi:hypothetical protein [Fictibacillus barbaricus]|uniref:SbsC C-terminal domain-containing protein n=1 Tax=Fictibacillus barbaricus TaxID=182136 RepID=A0ABS2ZJ49_9BACL|nr:hypothetical protein [Fictibacillus barbaricus]MBN3546725.1 hypothetical protein [Fictibacillus barbaricus]GGB43378.1 hypothetical protein GCM10007199_05850 [Fictibacillus barbaricus]